MRPVDVKLRIYTYFRKENDKKCPKFKIGDHLNINIFLQMTMFQIGLKFLWLKKLKTLCHDLKGEETVGAFYERELQKRNLKEFRVEKVIKRKGNKLYFHWKVYDSSFNSSIDKKDIIEKSK